MAVADKLEVRNILLKQMIFGIWEKKVSKI